jgi:hypothetical protein
LDYIWEVAVSHGMDSDWRAGCVKKNESVLQDINSSSFYIPDHYMSPDVLFSFPSPSIIPISTDLKKLPNFFAAGAYFVKEHSQYIPPNFFYSLISEESSPTVLSYRNSDHYLVGQLARELIVGLCPPHNSNKVIRKERSEWIVRKVINEVIEMFKYIYWKNNTNLQKLKSNSFYYYIPKSFLYTRLENASIIFIYLLLFSTNLF